MSQLVKQDKKLSPELSELEVLIIRNSKGLKVNQCRKGDIGKLVSDIVDSSLVVLGFFKIKYLPDERRVIENEIFNDILTKFKYLTFEEIREAVKMGARGEFKSRPDEIIIFSVSTIYHWLKCYSDTLRREALKKQSRFEQDNLKPKEKTEEELRKLENDFIYDCILAPYAHYVVTDQYLFDNRGNVIYNRLDKLNLIPFPPHIKRQFVEQAKEIVKASLISSPNYENQKRYDEIEKEVGDGYKLVISEAKNIALKAFFKDLKEQKADLEQLLK